MPIYNPIHTQGASVDRVTQATVIANAELIRVSAVGALIGIDASNITAYANLDANARIVPIYFQSSQDNPMASANLSLSFGVTDVQGLETLHTVDINITSPLIAEVQSAINAVDTGVVGVSLQASVTGNRLTIQAVDALQQGSVTQLSVLDSAHAVKVSLTDVRNPLVPFRYFAPDKRAVSVVGEIDSTPARHGHSSTTPLSAGVAEYEDRTSASLNRSTYRISKALDTLDAESARLEPEIVEIPLTVRTASSSSLVNDYSSTSPEARIIHGAGQVIVAIRGVTPAYMFGGESPLCQIVDAQGEPTVRVYASQESAIRSIRTSSEDFGDFARFADWYDLPDGMSDLTAIDTTTLRSLSSLDPRGSSGYLKVDPITIQFTSDVDNVAHNTILDHDIGLLIVREWLGNRRAIIGAAHDAPALRSFTNPVDLNDLPASGDVDIVRAPILHKGAWCIAVVDGYLRDDLDNRGVKLRLPVFSDRAVLRSLDGASANSDVYEHLMRLEGPQVRALPASPSVSMSDVRSYPMSAARGDLGHLPESDISDVDAYDGDKNTQATNRELLEDKVTYVRQARTPITLTQAAAVTSNRLSDVSDSGSAARADLEQVEASSALPESERQRYIEMLSQYISEDITIVRVPSDRDVAEVTFEFQPFDLDMVGRLAFISGVGNVLVTKQPSARMIEFCTLEPVQSSRSGYVVGMLSLLSRSDMDGTQRVLTLRSNATVQPRPTLNAEYPILGFLPATNRRLAEFHSKVKLLGSLGVTASMQRFDVNGVNTAFLKVSVPDTMNLGFVGASVMDLAGKRFEQGGQITSANSNTYTRDVQFEIHPISFKAPAVTVRGDVVFADDSVEGFVDLFVPVPAYAEQSGEYSVDDDVSVYVCGNGLEIGTSIVRAAAKIDAYDVQARELKVTTKANNDDRARFEITNADSGQISSVLLNQAAEDDLDTAQLQVSTSSGPIAEASNTLSVSRPGVTDARSVTTAVSSLASHALESLVGDGPSSAKSVIRAVAESGSAESALSRQHGDDQVGGYISSKVTSQEASINIHEHGATFGLNVDETEVTAHGVASRDYAAVVGNAYSSYDDSLSNRVGSVSNAVYGGVGDMSISGNSLAKVATALEHAREREHKLWGVVSALNSKVQYLHYAVKSLLGAVKELREIGDISAEEQSVTHPLTGEQIDIALGEKVHDRVGVLAEYEYRDANNVIQSYVPSDHLFHNLLGLTDLTGAPVPSVSHNDGDVYGLTVEDLLEASRALSANLISTAVGMVNGDDFDIDAQLAGINRPAAYDASSSGAVSGPAEMSTPYGSFSPVYEGSIDADNTDNNAYWSVSTNVAYRSTEAEDTAPIGNKESGLYIYGRPSRVPLLSTDLTERHVGMRILPPDNPGGVFSIIGFVGNDGSYSISTSAGGVPSHVLYTVDGIGSVVSSLPTLVTFHPKRRTINIGLPDHTDMIDIVDAGITLNVLMSPWWVAVDVPYTEGDPVRVIRKFKSLSVVADGLYDTANLSEDYAASDDHHVLRDPSDPSKVHIIRRPERVISDLKALWGTTLPFSLESDVRARWGSVLRQPRHATSNDVYANSATITINGVTYSVVRN